MVFASEAFYKAYIESDLSLSELAKQKNVKCSTANNYVCRHYKSEDAVRLLEKLGLNRQTVKRAYEVMVATQQYRHNYPSVNSATLTPYIHEALGNTCDSHCLATSIIRKLYRDLWVGQSS